MQGLDGLVLRGFWLARCINSRESPQHCPVGTAAAAPDCVLRAGGLCPGAEPSHAFSTHGVFEERAAAAAPLARGRFGQISFASQNEKGRIEGKKPGAQIKSRLFAPPKERQALAPPPSDSWIISMSIEQSFWL